MSTRHQPRDCSMVLACILHCLPPQVHKQGQHSLQRALVEGQLSSRGTAAPHPEASSSYAARVPALEKTRHPITALHLSQGQTGESGMRESMPEQGGDEHSHVQPMVESVDPDSVSAMGALCS